MVPPIPSTEASTLGDGQISLDEMNMENPYDEIPGGRVNGRQYRHNPYSEISDIPSGTRDSGVQLSMERTITPSQPDCTLIKFYCAHIKIESSFNLLS